MVAIIKDDEEARFEALADRSLGLLIFIVRRVTVRVVNRAARLAGPKLREGGSLVVADGLEAALDRVVAFRSTK